MTLAELKEKVDTLVEELGGIGHAEIPLYNYSTESWIDDIEMYGHERRLGSVVVPTLLVHVIDGEVVL